VPVPPLVDNAAEPPLSSVAGVAATDNGACSARTTVTPTVALAGAKVASPALVAVSEQLPTPVAVSVTPLTEHTPAPALTDHDTAPLPLPPLVDSVAVAPKARVDGEALATSGACASAGSDSVPLVVLPASTLPFWS